MTIMLSLEQDPDFLIQLLGDYGNRVPYRSYGSGKTGERVAEGQNYGFREGVAFALHRYADSQRMQYMRETGVQPVSYGKFVATTDLQEIGEFLNWFKEEWADKDRTEKFSKSEFWEIVCERFQNIVIDDKLKEQLEEERRKRVLAGVEDPKREDETWLIEQDEVYSAVVNPIRAALEKARAAKVEVKGL